MNNQRTVDGCDLFTLREKYKTPLILYSYSFILEKIEELKRDFLHKYPKTRVAYAAKAFTSMALVKILVKQGLCMDVVSAGELEMALAGGMDPANIEFNGNGKTPSEIQRAVEVGVGRMIVDSSAELQTLMKTCKKHNKIMKVLFRISPHVKVSTHDYISTGHQESKFGFAYDEEEIQNLIKITLESPFLDFYGFHFHIGSQLFEVEPYLDAIHRIHHLEEKTGVTLKEINLGGGFGVYYTQGDKPKPYRYYLEPMMKKLEELYGDKRPTVVIEPGRSLICEAGSTLYTIHAIKSFASGKTYYMIDGSMSDNIRPALYGAKYEGRVVGKEEEEKVLVDVAGKACESGDILIKDVLLPKAQPGDLLQVFSTGAYTYSMASHYNMLLKPAVVLCYQGKDALLIEREEYKDLQKGHLVPDFI